MARIKHPDTFLCDLCGDEMSEKEVNRVVAPFTSYHVATEYGLKLKDRLEYDWREFDLCDACLYHVLVIREVPRFHQKPEFEFIEEKVMTDV